MSGSRPLLALIGALVVGVMGWTTTAAAAPSASPTPSVTPTPTATPSGSPSPSPTGSASPSPSPSASPSAQDAAPELLVSITGQSPAVVLPDDTLRLDLSVENTGDTDVVDPLVTLGVQQEVPRNRGALLGWFDAEAPPRARTEWQSPVPATIPAGTTQSLVLEIPMTDLDFPVRFDNWGARGLEVTLTSGDGTTGRARTSGLFYPDEFEATPLDVAVLVPAVADAEEWRESVDAAAALAIERAPQPEELAPPAAVERAATLLGTGADVALDPALARVLPSSGPDAPTNGEGTVLALPWADADVAALPLDDDGKRLLTDALTRGTSDFAAAPIAASGTVLWPAGSALTLDALIALSRLDADGVVLEDPAAGRTASRRPHLPGDNRPDRCRNRCTDRRGGGGRPRARRAPRG